MRAHKTSTQLTSLFDEKIWRLMADVTPQLVSLRIQSITIDPSSVELLGRPYTKSQL